MRKTTLAALLLTALLSGSPANVNAQNYDFSKVDWTKMTEVFYKALAAGKQYPSDQEIMALGISRPTWNSCVRTFGSVRSLTTKTD